jgi:hypothetical protein
VGTIDEVTRREALYMSSFLIGTIWEQLVEHPAIAERAEWLALSKRAHQDLLDLYQAISAETLKEG